MYFLASVLYIFIHFTVGCSLTTGTNEAIHINPCASPGQSPHFYHGMLSYDNTDCLAYTMPLLLSHLMLLSIQRPAALQTMKGFS